MEPSKTNQTRWESTSCAIFAAACTKLICFVFVNCVQRRVVEGSGVGSGGNVVHVDVCGE